MSRVRIPVGKYAKRSQSTTYLAVAGMIGCLVAGIFIGRATKKAETIVEKVVEAAPVAVNKPKPKVKAPRTVWKVTLADHNPIKGPKDALVTLVEWSDYQ